jgi:CMP-N-acetylneuraminic acid synthetase
MDLAIDSEIFDQVIVNTDDSDIFSIARIKTGITPVVRRDDLSGDDVRADEVVRWQIKDLKLAPDDIVCCLLPTTPGLTKQELVNGYEKFNDNPKFPLFGISKMFQTPYRSFLFDKNDNRVTALFPERLLAQSQEYPETFTDAGQFYFANSKTWENTYSITASPDARGLILSASLHPDINTYQDWEFFVYQAERGQ